MTWRRSKIWVGLLAVLAPMPLPFNEMAVWPAAVAYVAVVSCWLLAVWRGAEALLPPWVLNVLGALYLPVLVVDLASAEGGQVLRPLVHVAMFATAAKLFALRAERDKWHALFGCFFLFVAGMGSSVHPALIAHMILFSVVAVAGLIHFAEAQSIRSFRLAAPIRGKGSLVAGIIIVSLIGCAVLFPLLPRIAQPYVSGAGAVDLGGASGVAAFVDDLTLDSIGRIRSNRGVALRLVFDGPVPREIRLKGSSYDLYRDHRWLRTQGGRFLRAESGGWVPLTDRGRSLGEVSVFSRVTGAPMMPMLVEGVAVESDARWLGLSPGGDVRPLRWRGAPMRYLMSYGSEAHTLATQPPNAETLDLAGITPGIAAYATRFLDRSDAGLEQVQALERHLQDDFNYSLDLDLDPDNPVEDFLLRERTGHCEYFASAMVLMLRSQGIPARVVSGFLGAEGNPLEAFYVVRNANAHAWVEAWVDDAWRILDPTPAVARPTRVTTRSTGLWQRVMDTYDWLIYRWDRYILTFSSEDQTNVFRAVWGSLKGFWAGFLGGGQIGEEATPTPAQPIVDPAPTTVESDSQEGGDWPWWLVASLALAVLIGVAFWWRRHQQQRLSATAIYLQLREAAPSAGIPADETSAPAGFIRLWAQFHPGVELELRRILDAYLEESFGGRAVGRDELSSLEESWQSISEQLPRAA